VTAVLVADPDRRTRRLTGAALRQAGYTVESTDAATRTMSLLRRVRPDALIVDPAEQEPVEMISALRAQTDVPILVVSRPVQERERVALLDAGADDYLTRPYGVEELLARLRVALRRHPASSEDETAIVTADFTVHLQDRRWFRDDGTEVRLTPVEWRLVEMLLRRPGHLVSQEDLLLGVWGPRAVDKPHYLRVHVASIRRKVEPEPCRPRYFITAPGLGLRFESCHGDRPHRS